MVFFSLQKQEGIEGGDLVHLINARSLQMKSFFSVFGRFELETYTI